MLKIGICTKQTDFANYVEKLLGSILSTRDKWSIEVLHPEAILTGRKESFLSYHIFCVDELLLKTQKIDIVSYLRYVRPEASILLLEGQKEKGMEGIRYHLFAYQINRLKQQDLEMELNRLYQYANTASHCLTIEKDRELISIPIQNIIYIESADHQVILHTTTKDFEYYEKMYKLEALLTHDDFIRCHKGYLISKHFVTGCSYASISLGQISLPIGRKYKESIHQAFGFLENNTIIQGSEKTGSIIGIGNQNRDNEFLIRPEQRILVGRDNKVADVVILKPSISRLHCAIIYHDKENTYEVVDFSKNGTYIGGAESDFQRLVPDTSYCVKPGMKIGFSDTDDIYYLG